MCLYFIIFFFFLMIRRPPRSTQSRSSAASDVYKRQFPNSAKEELVMAKKEMESLGRRMKQLREKNGVKSCLLYTSPSPRDS